MLLLVRRLLKYALYTLSVVAFLLAGSVAYLVWFQPAFYSPKPTGPYAVEYVDYHWIDTKRQETLSKDPAHPHRELMVKVWFPSVGVLPDKPTSPYAPYLTGYLKKNHFLIWLFGFSRPIYSYAVPVQASKGQMLPADAPKFPVVLLSHGMGTVNYDNYAADCEELASHGYIVVGINHTYGCLFTQFPDGRVVEWNKNYGSGAHSSNFTQVREYLGNVLETWVADVQFVLNQLETVSSDKNEMFYQRLDVQNVGIFGHSLGGATAAHVCQRDSRVKAGVNLDGGLWGPAITKPFDKPFMSLMNENIANGAVKPMSQHARDEFKIISESEEKAFQSIAYFSIVDLARLLGHDSYVFVIQGTNHMDFSDLALLKHTSRFLRILTGTIGGFRATEIVNAYLLNFFDKYLKGQPSELLDGQKSVYPEIERRQ